MFHKQTKMDKFLDVAAAVVIGIWFSAVFLACIKYIAN